MALDSFPDAAHSVPLARQGASPHKNFALDEEGRRRLAEATAPRVIEAIEAGSAEDYGLDLAFRSRSEPLFKFLFENYWRVDLQGLDNLPEQGGAILVGNHSGALPLDATMVCYALSNVWEPGRVVRPLFDAFVEGMGPVADAYRKMGGAPARYAVADDLLGRGEMPLIFPEGVNGVAKLFDERYKLRRFATSAARLSLRHRVPIIPFAVIGAEETYPVIGRSRRLGRLLGAPYMPITPLFPLLGLGGLLPLPTRWTLVFGRRVYLYRENRFRGEGSTDFDAMSQRLRRTVQVLIRRKLGQRKSIFLG